MFKLFDHDKDGLLNRRDLMKAGACSEGTALQVTPPGTPSNTPQDAYPHPHPLPKMLYTPSNKILPGTP